MSQVSAVPAAGSAAHTGLARREGGNEPAYAAAAVRVATGMAPYEWLVRERVAIARELLEVPTPLPTARVAELSGFGSEESLRRHFRRIALTSPGAYRKKFGVRETA